MWYCFDNIAIELTKLFPTTLDNIESTHFFPCTNCNKINAYYSCLSVAFALIEEM